MATIHPTAQVSSKTEIAADVEIGAYSIIGDDVAIGPGCKIANHCTILGPSAIGENNLFFPYAAIGTAPQDISYKNEATRLKIGNNNVFREFTTVNRATLKEFGQTVIGNNCFLMAYSHVAHDCILGDNVILANAVQLGGHVRLGHYASLGGMVGVHHFVTIGEHSFIAGMARVLKDVPPFMMADGRPARVRAVNTIGLSRRGFSAEQIRAIKETHKLLWRSEYTASQALKILEENINTPPEKLPADTPKIIYAPIAKEHLTRLLEFIKNTQKVPRGRSREANRSASGGPTKPAVTVTDEEEIE